MIPPSYRVFEIRNANGLPTYVGCCRDDEQPAMKRGESFRWLIGVPVPIDKPQAERIARARIAQICRWATGDAALAPHWLRNLAAIPPRLRGSGHGRYVWRVWPDGRRQRFPSVLAAAKAINRHRNIIDRRLRDGRPDHTGCRWSADRKCDRFLPVTARKSRHTSDGRR
jgi:hypothetical protein